MDIRATVLPTEGQDIKRPSINKYKNNGYSNRIPLILIETKDIRHCYSPKQRIFAIVIHRNKGCSMLVTETKDILHCYSLKQRIFPIVIHGNKAYSSLLFTETKDIPHC